MTGPVGEDSPRDRGLSSYPDIPLVGISEIAERLEVERATVDVWRYRKRLPPERWLVSGNPIWLWPDIEQWARDTGRLPAPSSS